MKLSLLSAIFPSATCLASADDPVPPEGMALIKGGNFSMGSKDGASDEQPVHEVTLKSFFMDKTSVTNAQFAEATKYVTTAERVTRGGSWMCADNYCRGYRPATRMKVATDTEFQNTGFRCVKDLP
jgi:formylglycine-generating enzyme required for sulfatase activity